MGPAMSAKRRRTDVDTIDWFERVFGFREYDVDNPGMDKVSRHAMIRGKFEYSPEKGELSAVGQKGLYWDAGSFETPKLEELRNRYKRNEKDIKQLLGGQLTAKEVVGDVSLMHAKEENRRAMFQAASQFNCLEFTSERGVPEDGVTVYTLDHTQGPACAIACSPGTVVRNYFGLGGDPQTASRQVENLKEVEQVLENEVQKYFEVRNGYTLASDEGLEKLGKTLEDKAKVEAIKSNLRIGLQLDTEFVCTTFGNRFFEEAKPGVQLVSQAYCSAISVAYSKCQPELWKPFACAILDAAYEATFYAAMENARKHKGEQGSRRLFLTALGGGVFGNDMAWIEEAIGKAMEQFKDVQLEVYMVSFGQSEPAFKRLERP
jgi:hypothetical protein